MKKLTTSLALCVLFAGSGVAQAALVDRGGGLIYDDVLNVTWLQNVTYGAGSSYDNGWSNTDGLMTWSSATAWAENLIYYDSVRNVTYDNWRLPSLSPANGVSFNYAFSTNGTTDYGYNMTGTRSEAGYMYYADLGNPASVGGNNCYPCGKNAGPFINLTSMSTVWFGAADAPYADQAWNLDYWSGLQRMNPKTNQYLAWAVRDGDVAAVSAPTTVPVPAAAWLLGSGLLGMFGVAKRKFNS